MECAELRNWLSRKIDGELSTSETAELDAHLAQCASCAREYGLLSLPRRFARRIPQPVPSPFFYQRLRTHIESESKSISGWRIFWELERHMIPALAGITLALLSVLVYLQLNGPHGNLSEYERVFITEEQPHLMLAADQGEITDASVLSAIAGRDAHRQHGDGK